MNQLDLFMAANDPLGDSEYPPVFSIAGTGHRPKSFKGGYKSSDQMGSILVPFIKNKLKMLYSFFKEDGVEGIRIISGMAQGWDTWLAEAAIDLQESEVPIQLLAAVPCKNHVIKWPEEAQLKHEYILSNADEVVYVSENYSAAAMQIRNEFMVDRCNLLLAAWDGTPSGGTYNCIRYAESRRKNLPIINLWDEINRLI